MDEKKRKSSRSFDLEKGGKRSFDLDKMSARKFDLAKDSDEVSLEELKKDLPADGIIDAAEVNKLRDVFYTDGKIDQEEADFVFELNDAVSGKKNDPSWNQFFVQVISDYLLNDEKSPGVIDEEEGKWLVEKIGSDGKVDSVEKQLLEHLKKNAKKMPASVTALLDGTPISPSSSVSTEESSSHDSDEPTSKKWLWILLAIVIAAVITFFCVRSCNANKEEQLTEQTTEFDTGENEEQVSDIEKSSEENQEEMLTDETMSDTPSIDTQSDVTEDPSTSNPEDVTNIEQTPIAENPSPERPIVSDNSNNPVATPSPTGTVEEEALDVIRGKYGNGEERKRNLGDRYEEIQSMVNEMYRNGLVQ